MVRGYMTRARAIVKISVRLQVIKAKEVEMGTGAATRIVVTKMIVGIISFVCHQTP